MNEKIALYTIIIFAILDAGLKAWMDYYVKEVSKKFSSFSSERHLRWFIIEAVVFTGVSIILGLWIGILWTIPLLILIGGLVYWSVFDCLIGYLLTGSIWHIGTTGWDVWFENVFQNGRTFLIVKLGWLALGLGAYCSLFIF
ncbi:MAG TPA: hypothetical protein VJ963_11800 [Bacteroidales bacterium]|nr:hypothetical protein [Bacteroidales bacterium]